MCLAPVSMNYVTRFLCFGRNLWILNLSYELVSKTASLPNTEQVVVLHTFSQLTTHDPTIRKRDIIKYFIHTQKCTQNTWWNIQTQFAIIDTVIMWLLPLVSNQLEFLRNHPGIKKNRTLLFLSVSIFDVSLSSSHVKVTMRRYHIMVT